MKQVAYRYSQTFYEMMEVAGLLREAQHDARVIFRLSTEDPRFAEHLGSHLLSHAKKIALLDKLFSQTLHRQTCKFLRFMLHKRRGKQIVAMAEQFIVLAKERSGLLEGKLRAPTVFSETWIENLKGLFKRHLGKEVTLTFVMDKELLGGFTLHLDNRLYDFSLKGQLERLGKAFGDQEIEV